MSLWRAASRGSLAFACRRSLIPPTFRARRRRDRKTSPQSLAFRVGIALLAGLPSCSEYSVCDRQSGDCQLAPQTSSETIFLWESQALRVEPNPSGEAATSRVVELAPTSMMPSRTKPSQMQPLKQWQNLGMDGEAQTALTLMLAEADQQAWQVLPADGRPGR